MTAAVLSLSTAADESTIEMADLVAMGSGSTTQQTAKTTYRRWCYVGLKTMIVGLIRLP